MKKKMIVAIILVISMIYVKAQEKQEGFIFTTVKELPITP